MLLKMQNDDENSRVWGVDANKQVDTWEDQFTKKGLGNNIYSNSSSGAMVLVCSEVMPER